MKTDRELLELAAKAVGLSEGIGGAFWTEFGIFDPLTDDGDALRLAVKLGISIENLEPEKSVHPHSPEVDARQEVDRVRQCNDQNLIRFWRINSPQKFETAYSATRRAIVHAAAAIGEAM